MAYFVKNTDDSPVMHDGVAVFMSLMDNVVKGVDMKTRQLNMIGSDESVDRDGDVIMVNGWDLNNFLKNPVFLWSHVYHGPESVPLARAIKVIKRRTPARLDFVLQFPTEGINPFADMILSLYNEKIINASSVGFIPREWKPMDENSSEMDMMFGAGRRFVKQELLELSGCAVPCNPAALQNAVKGFLHQQTTKEHLQQVVNWTMGKAVLDPKIIGIDEVELAGEFQELKCEVEEDNGLQVQVPDKITQKEVPQGVDNTGKKDYNINQQSAEGEVVETDPTDDVKTQEEKDQAMLKELKEKNPDITYFKLNAADGTGDITLEPVGLESLKSEFGVEARLALAFGDKITLVEPQEFVKLLGIPEVPTSTEEVPEKETEVPEGKEAESLDTTKLLDSLKKLSAILPEVK